MDANSERQNEHDDALLLLNTAIEALNLAKDLSEVLPAKAVFATVSTLLTMIRVRVPLFSNDPLQVQALRNQDSMMNKIDWVELGVACADVCRALDRGLNGRRVDELSQSVFEAIGQLTT